MKNCRKGFTLIENIVVMILLTVIIAGSLNLHPTVLRFVARQEQRLIANNLAYSQIEDLRRIARSVNFNDPTTLVQLPVGQSYGPTPSISVGNYVLTYTVTDRAWPNNPPPPTNYKIVTVRCTTPSGYVAQLTGDVTP